MTMTLSSPTLESKSDVQKQKTKIKKQCVEPIYIFSEVVGMRGFIPHPL